MTIGLLGQGATAKTRRGRDRDAARRGRHGRRLAATLEPSLRAATAALGRTLPRDAVLVGGRALPGPDAAFAGLRPRRNHLAVGKRPAPKQPGPAQGCFKVLPAGPWAVHPKALRPRMGRNLRRSRPIAIPGAARWAFRALSRAQEGGPPRGPKRALPMDVRAPGDPTGQDGHRRGTCPAPEQPHRLEAAGPDLRQARHPMPPHIAAPSPPSTGRAKGFAGRIRDVVQGGRVNGTRATATTCRPSPGAGPRGFPSSAPEGCSPMHAPKDRKHQGPARLERRARHAADGQAITVHFN